jgi:hypothetical protein
LKSWHWDELAWIKRREAISASLPFMRIWVNFTRHDPTWSVQCLSEDARTVISPQVRIARESTLLNLLRASGADEPTILAVSRDMQQTGHGTVAVDVNSKGIKLLQIKQTF